MPEQKILVTGAAGFIGGHVCRRLASQGYSVRGLVRKASESLKSSGIELAVGDLTDSDSLQDAVKGVDVIYHIAAIFRSNVSRKQMWDTNVMGTRRLLDLAVRSGIQRFVYCSTVGVHGEIRTRTPANEETPYGPGDDYQATKTEAEKVVLEYLRGNRLPITIFRPGGVYGPGDTRFLKLVKGVHRRRFVMIGSGKVLYQMIYIDDLVDGILLCGSLDRAIGNIYILSGEQPTTLNELVGTVAEVLQVRGPRFHIPFAPVYAGAYLCELVCRPLKIEPPIFRRRIDFFRKDRAFDISKAKRELGFRPKVDLKTGLQLTVSWYRHQGLL